MIFGEEGSIKKELKEIRDRIKFYKKNPTNEMDNEIFA